MDANLYNQSAEKIGKVELSDSVFAVPMNKDLLYQVITSQIANKRQPLAHIKQRGEVRGGGRKPWKQKGTGRARHGSIRSPIWKGGGVTFGPRNERNFKKKINKKMARRALFIALSSKIHDNELVFVNEILLENWKTKEMAKTLKKISSLFPTTKHNNMLLVTDKKMSNTVERTARNLTKVDVIEAKNLNALDVMARKNLLMIKEAVEVIMSTFVN